MVKSTGSLAEGVANSASEAHTAAHRGGSTMEEMNKMMDEGRYSDKKTSDDEEPKELFGGLDLAKVKSTIEDKPAEGSTSIIGGKGIGVYREILAVNKSMAASLLRINETLKMLLSIEYERIQGMVRESTGDNGDKSYLSGAGGH